jgi:beta-N-acetylhexosaminidase
LKAAIVGISGPALTEAEAARFLELPPAGAILFARNVADPDQLRHLTRALRVTLPQDAVIAVDQEGGRVARLRPPHWRAHPPAAAIGALGREPGRRAAWLTGALIGLDCAHAGIDLVCAPVLDLRLPQASDVIGDRSFGADPDHVAALGRALA